MACGRCRIGGYKWKQEWARSVRGVKSMLLDLALSHIERPAQAEVYLRP